MSLMFLFLKKKVIKLIKIIIMFSSSYATYKQIPFMWKWPVPICFLFQTVIKV